MPKYMGPSDTFRLEEGGKEYHPGDNVPMSKEMVGHHERLGHVFETTPEPEPTLPSETVAVPPVHAPSQAPVHSKSPS